MRGVNITFNNKSGRFIIASPPWLVDKMRGIPNRRWDGPKKVWTAPAIRANARYLLDTFPPECFADDAAEAANKALDAVKVNVGADFPEHYAFKTKPFQHQLDGLKKMYPKNAFALFMEMRTGKTKLLIDYASAHHMMGNLDSVVIVCPHSVRRNWRDELAVHCPHDHSVHILDTSKPKKFDEWNTSGHPFRWLIVGVKSLDAGSATSLAEKFLLTSVKTLMAVDESHTIKGHSTKRGENCTSLGRRAERRAILTGTPIANGPMDLFMQFEFLDPNIIGVGDYYSFRNRYAVMGGYDNKQIIGYQNHEELMEIVSPFVYQVFRKDVFDLPPVINTSRVVEMTKKQTALYNAMVKTKSVALDDGVLVAQSVLEKMLRLHEISGGTVAYENPAKLVEGAPKSTPKFLHKRIEGGSAKLDELISVLEDITGSVIIWAVYRDEIAMIVEALVGKYGRDQVVEVHGGIDEDTRHRNVYGLFQTKKARFIVGNVSTGGVGLKMSAAETVIYYSNSFSYTDRAQSRDRTQSSDQTKSVLYIDIVCEGTVDEIVLEALNNKQDVLDYVNKSINEINARISLAA